VQRVIVFLFAHLHITQEDEILFNMVFVLFYINLLEMEESAAANKTQCCSSSAEQTADRSHHHHQGKSQELTDKHICFRFF